jgi:hypothetical protein
MNHLHQTVHHQQDGAIKIKRWKVCDESQWKLKTTWMHGSIMVERDHEGDDEDFLFKHKHHKIQQIPSHTFKVVAINNFEIQTLVESKMTYN